MYVNCPTRHAACLDLCYGNISEAYRAKSLPGSGCSDHNMIQLIPVYQQAKIWREPVRKIQLQVWSSQAIETLQGCYTCTDWNVFTDSADSLDESVEVISDYIRFCVDMVISQKTVKICPNNKPWITKDLKKLLNEKKRLFYTGTKDEQKEIVLHRYKG